MAILADGDGFAVLDQENLRILRYGPDATLRGQVPIPDRATTDAVSLGDGFGLLSYHRLPDATWELTTLDEQGGSATSVALPEMEPPTGVFAYEGHLLVEEAHGSLLDPITGVRYPGRPDGHGWFVSAEKTGETDLVLTWSRLDGNRRPVRLHTDRILSNVVALDPIEDGAVVTLLLYDEGPAPRYAMQDAELRVVSVDRWGHRRDEARLPVGLKTDMTRHLAIVGDTLLQLRTSPDGVEVARIGVTR
jgi:hypothetical protein